MNANSPSETLWELLHQARALLVDEGFADPAPPLPRTARRSSSAPGGAYADLAASYGEFLAFGTQWPSGTGTGTPQALILTAKPLTDEARTFVRSWFENSRVNLNLEQDFFTQPMPVLDGERPPYHLWAKELCTVLAPKAVLSLGVLPAQRLLGAPLSLDTLRGSDYRFDRWTIVTTLDPEEFSVLDEVGKARFKAQVWKDLQRLLGKLKYA